MKLSVGPPCRAREKGRKEKIREMACWVITRDPQNQLLSTGMWNYVGSRKVQYLIKPKP